MKLFFRNRRLEHFVVLAGQRMPVSIAKASRANNIKEESFIWRMVFIAWRGGQDFL
jgi:hypothetical protein